MANKRRREFTASTTFTVPATCSQVRVLAVGGGASGSASNAEAVGGCGGGIVEVFQDVTAGQTLTITIGAGGSSVTSQNSTTGLIAPNPGSATTVTSSSPSTISITAPGATASAPGNELGGVGASRSTNWGGANATGIFIALPSARPGLADGGGGGGLYYSGPNNMPSGISGGAGFGPTDSQPANNVVIQGGNARPNSGSGGGGAGGYAGRTQSAPVFISGTGGSGIVILEWEEN